jgi:hypothetical protein
MGLQITKDRLNRVYAQTQFELHNTQFCVTTRTLLRHKIVFPTQKDVTHFTQFFCYTNSIKFDKCSLYRLA